VLRRRFPEFSPGAKLFATRRSHKLALSVHLEGGSVRASRCYTSHRGVLVKNPRNLKITHAVIDAARSPNTIFKLKKPAAG
jgi:hypothetical protein